MINDAQQKLKIPAIGLLISAILNGSIGAVTLISGLLRFSGMQGKEILPTVQAEKIGYLISTFAGYGIALLSLIATPIIVFGAIRMLKGKSRGLVVTSAILSILPLTACCFLVSAIFGIWALVVLRNPDVKMFFQNDGEQTNLYPPQPPQNW